MSKQRSFSPGVQGEGGGGAGEGGVPVLSHPFYPSLGGGEKEVCVAGEKIMGRGGGSGKEEAGARKVPLAAQPRAHFLHATLIRPDFSLRRKEGR